MQVPIVTTKTMNMPEYITKGVRVQICDLIKHNGGCPGLDCGACPFCDDENLGLFVQYVNKEVAHE